MWMTARLKSIQTVCLVIAVTLSCATAAAAQVCENSSPRLDGARKCAVFEAGDAKVAASHGDPTGVDGNLCMAADSELSMSGGQVITGTAFLDPLVAKVPDDLDERAGAVVVEDQSAAVLAVASSVLDLDALVCDVVFAGLKIDSSQTWNVSDFNPPGSEAVVCVDGNMEVKGSGTVLTLSGAPGESFVFKIGGAFKVNGAKIVAADIAAADVLYYVEGTGSDVAFSGGGGGLGCCKAAVDGTILAPERKVKLSPGRVNGQVISGKDISLSSGSLVSCPPEPDPPATCPCDDNPDLWVQFGGPFGFLASNLWDNEVSLFNPNFTTCTEDMTGNVTSVIQDPPDGSADAGASVDTFQGTCRAFDDASPYDVTVTGLSGPQAEACRISLRSNSPVPCP